VTSQPSSDTSNNEEEKSCGCAHALSVKRFYKNYGFAIPSAVSAGGSGRVLRSKEPERIQRRRICPEWQRSSSSIYQANTERMANGSLRGSAGRLLSSACTRRNLPNRRSQKVISLAAASRSKSRDREEKVAHHLVATCKRTRRSS
jgi:hypothetical protein